MRRETLAILFACWACFACRIWGPAMACPAAGDDSAKIVAVEPGLELKLDDGRLVRLAGLDPPQATPGDPQLAERARADLSTRLAGKSVDLVMLAEDPDRWERFPALAFLDGEATAGGLAALLVGEGQGRYRAEAAAHACRDALLEAEAKARSAKLGLWRDPYYGVLAVDDRAAFPVRSGSLVLAEGRLAAVETSRFRTMLRFVAPKGPDSFGGHMLVATIMPHAMKSFGTQQMDFTALIGRRLRFRGLFDMRFGPRVELQTPDEVEVLAPDAARN